MVTTKILLLHKHCLILIFMDYYLFKNLIVVNIYLVIYLLPRECIFKLDILNIVYEYNQKNLIINEIILFHL